MIPRARGAVLACAALLVAGCAAPLKFDASADPLSVLGPSSMVYARLGGASARALAPSILPPAQAKSLDAVLSRTRLVAIGMGSPPGDPEFEACLIGDYPFRAASLSLGSDPAWKREKAGYYNAKLGLRLAIPGPGIVVASTGGLEPLLAGAKAPGPSPIPARLAPWASKEIAIWAPEPFAGLVAALVGEPMDLPVRGLLIAASPVGTASASPNASDIDYVADIIFLMSDPESARVFRPALRLAWYGIARSLLGDEAQEALTAPFTLEGDIYSASGVRLSGRALARGLGALKSGILGPDGP